MKRICAWCRKKLGSVDSRSGTEDVITHGICKNCGENLMFQMGVELEEFLNSLKLPVVVVNGTGTIVTGNDHAQKLLRKRPAEIQGYQGGEVFECAYARLPEGCGNTMHCSGCTIRRTVTDTYRTGKSFSRVPATLDTGALQKPERIKLLISTEKIAELVLLRIDEIESQIGPCPAGVPCKVAG
jgi:transcriptional regulator with PAS, ATPase and Fis domain